MVARIAVNAKQNIYRWLTFKNPALVERFSATMLMRVCIGAGVFA